MAYIVNGYCLRCERDTQHTNSKCDICAERENRERIAVWNSLITDEKLQDLRRRIERLENRRYDEPIS